MYDFIKQISKFVNTGQTRSLVLSGNIDDVYWDGLGYTSLIQCLSNEYKIAKSASTRGIVQVLYEVNKSIKIVGDTEGQKWIKLAWQAINPKDDLEDLLKKTYANPTLALEVLRQLTLAARKRRERYDLMIIIERCEFLIPQAETANMKDSDRKRVLIMHDWLSDLEFLYSTDTVILIAESLGQIHSLVSKLPQVLEVQIPYPDYAERFNFLKVLSIKDPDSLATQTAGLSLHALRQITCEDKINKQIINQKVESYICSQLGEGVVEFKRPSHTLDDVIGFKRIKNFIKDEMIPRFKMSADSALVGAAIAGPIGGGKTFIMEAMASELDMPVLVLKNLRSQWYGQTDVIFDRLKRTLTALDKVMIFVDEADTQFGGVDGSSHETERRLTGKIQAMMSDVTLKGKVFWLLMTARIERLSPDIRRPGRAGDLIIPILDPEAGDRLDFIYWVITSSLGKDLPVTDQQVKQIEEHTRNYSAASFAALRSLAKAKQCKSVHDIIYLAKEIIPSDIEQTRRIQTLQALLNCTRKSLLPLPSGEEYQHMRSVWQNELKGLVD